MMKMFKKKTRVLNAELPRPLQRNAMSTLYANLGFMSFDKPMRTIVVTSSVPNEGKTTVAVELARVMGRGGEAHAARGMRPAAALAGGQVGGARSRRALRRRDGG